MILVHLLFLSFLGDIPHDVGIFYMSITTSKCMCLCCFKHKYSESVKPVLMATCSFTMSFTRLPNQANFTGPRVTRLARFHCTYKQNVPPSFLKLTSFAE